jgi:hypothetical protein
MRTSHSKGLHPLPISPGRRYLLQMAAERALAIINTGIHLQQRPARGRDLQHTCDTNVFTLDLGKDDID